MWQVNLRALGDLLGVVFWDFLGDICGHLFPHYSRFWGSSWPRASHFGPLPPRSVALPRMSAITFWIVSIRLKQINKLDVACFSDIGFGDELQVRCFFTVGQTQQDLQQLILFRSLVGVGEVPCRVETMGNKGPHECIMTKTEKPMKSFVRFCCRFLERHLLQPSHLQWLRTFIQAGTVAFQAVLGSSSWHGWNKGACVCVDRGVREFGHVWTILDHFGHYGSVWQGRNATAPSPSLVSATHLKTILEPWKCMQNISNPGNTLYDEILIDIEIYFILR